MMMTGSSSANATATPTLETPVIEEKGMVTGQRVLEVSPWPKTEASFIANDTLRGNIAVKNGYIYINNAS